jgi:hypothetical protein
MKTLFITAIAFSALLLTSCMEQTKKEIEGKELLGTQV